MTPTALAWIALVAWPALAIGLYTVGQGRTSVARTTAWTAFLPVMFLPTRVELKLASGIPALDKHRIALLSIMAGLVLFAPRPASETLRAHRFARAILIALVLGAVVTVRTNAAPLRFGPTLLPGLDNHDLLSIAGVLVLDVYLPFAIGERVFRSERDVRDLFEVMVSCAMLYAPLAIVELLLSPQLHRWFYGFHQHEFVQSVRGSGFRPMVFMNHGLSVAMFYFDCLLAALGLSAAKLPSQASPGTRATVVGVMLLLCKSLASILYGSAAVLAHHWASNKTKARLVVLLAAIVITYPLVRANDLLPEHDIVEFFRSISGERAQSLLYRLNQEQQLLERASERLFFGWGSWGRNHVYADWGGRLTVADGYWIILIGAFGLVGFLGFFALITVPLFRYARAWRGMSATAQALVGSLALIVAFNAFDLLPNALSDRLPLVLAGALFALTRRRSVSGFPGQEVGPQRTGRARAAGAL